MQKTAIELFAGVGGFRCGLNKVTLKDNKVSENGNWTFLWANQFEPATKSQDAYNCYVKRFGKENTSNVDINLINKKTIPNHTLLTGGFPCQDYSVARTLSNEKGIEGKKGVLWWSIADILKEKHPPFVLLENVDRLLISPSKQRGRDFGIILRSFLDNGYGVEWRVINAGEYSLPQKRKRTFIFAFYKDTNYFKTLEKMSMKDIIFKDGLFAKTFPVLDEYQDENKANISKENYKDLVELNNSFKTQFFNSGIMINGQIITFKVSATSNPIKPFKDILETGDVDEKYFIDDETYKKFVYLKGSKKIPRTKPNGEPYIYSEGAMPCPDNPESPARTILTSEGGISRMTHVVEDIKTKKMRLLTPIECERIQTFPDDWTNTGMSQRKRNFMMGNALVVKIVEKLGEEIERIIEKE